MDNHSQTSSPNPNSSSFVPGLPLELWEYIIDMFHGWEHPFDIVAICLVCRAWVPRARLRLYSDVVLLRHTQAEKFLEVLVANPRYGPLILSLFIWPTSSSEEPPLLHCQWIHQIILTLPPFLPNIRTLRLMELPPLHPTFPMLCSRFKTVQ